MTREPNLRNPLAFYHRKILIIFAVLCFAGSIFAQTRSSDFKADKNLRSNARINPSTLAMEFSLPLGAYPGRAGNSIPLGLNYSSKVWTMKKHGFSRRNDGGGGTQQSPSLISTFLSFQPEYSKRAVAGWTSSLQPISILSRFEWYGGGSMTENEPDCVLIATHEEETINCPGGALIEVWSCTEPNSSLAPIIREIIAVCNGASGGGGGGGTTPTNPNAGGLSMMVKRVMVAMPEGTTKEFRKDDVVYDCYAPNVSCTGFDGSYVSTDGSGARLVMKEDQGGGVLRNVIHGSDGSRYLIDDWSGSSELIDKNGNKTTYDSVTKKWTDTMGREITSPLPPYHPGAVIGTVSYPLPAMSGQTREVEQDWQQLVDAECINGNESECQNNAIYLPPNFPGTPNSALQSLGSDTCENITALTNPTLTPTSGTPLFEHSPAEEDPLPGANGTNPAYDFKHYFVTCGGVFNPIVLKSIKLPDGSKYHFKYNNYGEITKIIYPTGAYERFNYARVNTISAASHPFDQTNRGVVERWVSEDGVNETQNWKYSVGWHNTPSGIFAGTTTIAPDDTKTESIVAISDFSHFWGFEDPLAGRPVEERVYAKRADPNDPNGARTLLKRTLTEWITEGPRPGGNALARRDARVSKAVSIIFENGKALATLNETEYDENGHSDPEYFSHLNPKRQKSYHYKALSLNMAETGNIATIAALFSNDTPASITETDYSYDSSYKLRGILGRPVETRVMDPTNPTVALSKTQMVYDEGGNYALMSENATAGWVDPNSVLRGNVTTTKTSLMDPITNQQSWFETHARHDIFGNLRQVWDAAGNIITTVYEDSISKPYKFAYQTKIITFAADPTDAHGSNQTSEVSNSYDFNTGLVTTVTDVNGQVTTTEYQDLMLRPTKIIASGGAQAVTEYGQPDTTGHFPQDQRFVKVKKQIDELNWDEAITFMDSTGRTVKTQAKDSQGDVFVETAYDNLGRIDRVSNAYRNGDTVYWSKNRYDDQNRTVEIYAPTILANLDNAQSLGTTVFDISTGTNYVGTVIISNDASGRKSRTITNARGQLIRVDEPTAFGGSATNDLGALDTPHQPTTYKYNHLGKMVEVSQGVQKRYFLYDNLGRLLRVKQPEQEANPNLATTFGIGNNAWSAGFTYDIRGNILTAIDANDTIIYNTYDNAGRVKARSYEPGQGVAATPPVNYYYDGKGVTGANFALGKLTKVTSSVSETRYTNFDPMGRTLSTEQVTDGQIYRSKYKYNLSSALVEQTYPSGEVVRNFLEDDGDLSRISVSGQTFVSDFTYTASAKLKSFRLGNGRWESGKLNERGQVTEIALGTSKTDGSLWKVQYEYGELTSNGNLDTSKNTGNIATQTTDFSGLLSPLTQTYKYDSLDRLIEAKEPTGPYTQNWLQTFGYDRFGNRTSFSQNVEGHQLTIDSSTLPIVSTGTNRFESNQGYIYDKAGNIICDSINDVRQFIYNGDNKQIQVKDNNGNPVGTYFYDGNGKRVKKVTGDETTVFVYDGVGKLIAEYSSHSTQTPTISYTATDPLGSPRAITDKLGNISSRRDFMPFGEELHAGIGDRTENSKFGFGDDNLRKRFTGYEKDTETGLDFAEARYYNTSHGRFTAIDPLLASGEPANPQTFNRYIYVTNRPLSLTDPSGLQATTEVADVVDYNYGNLIKMTGEFVFAVKNREAAFAIGLVEQNGTNLSSIAARFPIHARTTGTMVGLNEHKGALAGLGSDVNAVRHTLWQAIITRDFSADIATEAGDSHETYPNKSLDQRNFGKASTNSWERADETADLLNNRIGREIGEKNASLGNREMALKVLEHYRKSGLYIVNSTSTGNLVVQRVTISEEQYKNAVAAVSKLDNIGFTPKQQADRDKRRDEEEKQRRENQRRLPAKYQEEE